MKLLATLLTLITSINSLQLTTNELWRMNGNVEGTLYLRPEWAKNITINYEEKKITSIEGIIIPIHTDNWRPNSNADPLNDCPVGKLSKNDRGHILALSNGGPNIKENIIPQPNIWQQSGEWRKLEKKINKLTLEEYDWENTIYLDKLQTINEPVNKVYWKINLIYKDVCELEEKDCNCQPIKYNGIVKTQHTNYQFEIVNNGVYTWEEITEENDFDDALKYGLMFLTIGVVVCIFWMIGYYIYKKCINQRILEEQVNSIDLETGQS